MSDSLNDSFTIQELIKSPRQSSISISFSSHECPLNYSTDIDEAEHDNDENEIFRLPISPVSPDNVVEQAQAETAAKTKTELLEEEPDIVEQADDTAAIKTEEEESD